MQPTARWTLMLCAFPVCCLLGGLSATAALGQNPTLSLEVTAVNSTPLPEPVTKIKAGPGDVLTVQLFVRDWSPDGETLRAVQASIDTHGYISGYSGNVKPVNYDAALAKVEENKENGFIDVSNPRYVFAELTHLAMVDTRSYGYRYLNLVLAHEDARPCAQDGVRYYYGTLKLRVSDDASGPFILGFDEDPAASVIRDPQNQTIIPLDFERLTIDVVGGAVPLRLISSDPPSGAIDARLSKQMIAGPTLQTVGKQAGKTAPHCGWKTVDLNFNGDAGGLTAEDLTVEEGGSAKGAPPLIRQVLPKGSVVTVVFDRGIRSRKWTTIKHTASGTGIRLASLPGDVNNDSAVNADDLLALIYRPDSADPLPSYRCDIDRDGSSGVSDALRIIDVLNHPTAYRAVLRSSDWLDSRSHKQKANGR